MFPNELYIYTREKDLLTSWGLQLVLLFTQTLHELSLAKMKSLELFRYLSNTSHQAKQFKLGMNY